MPGYTSAVPLLGYRPATEIYTPTTTAQFPLGMTLIAYDEFFGQGMFMYGKAAGTLAPGNICYPDFGMVMTIMPSTAGLGYPLYVARADFTVGQYGWFQFAGQCPVIASASVAAGVVVGIGTSSGQAGTNTAGKQINGAIVVKASTYAPTQSIRTHNNSLVIDVTTTAGLVKGLAVTGTGVGASAKVVTINPSGNQITVDVVSTASAVVTGTFTWTGFLLLAINSPFSQGAIL